MYPDDELGEYLEHKEHKEHKEQAPKEKDEYESMRPKFHTGPKVNKPQVLQKKEFRTSMRNFFIFAIVVFLAYGYIFFQVKRTLDPLPNTDGLKVGGMVVSALMGVAILVFVVIVSYFNRNKAVIFSPDTLEFIHGNINFEAKWKAIIFSKSPDKSIYRVGTILAGNKRVYIDNLFFTKYDTICSLLERACEASANTEIEL